MTITVGEVCNIKVSLIDHPAGSSPLEDEELNPILVESIRDGIPDETGKRHPGLLVPIVVRPSKTNKGRYELLTGRKRVRAFMELGHATIPAHVRTDIDGGTGPVPFIQVGEVFTGANPKGDAKLLAALDKVIA